MQEGPNRTAHSRGLVAAPRRVAEHRMRARVRPLEVSGHRGRTSADEQQTRARRQQFLVAGTQLRRPFAAEQSTEVAQEHGDRARRSELRAQRRRGARHRLQRDIEHGGGSGLRHAVIFAKHRCVRHRID